MTNPPPSHTHLERLGDAEPSGAALFTAFCVVQGVREGQTRGGDAFVDLRVRDGSGTQAAKLWSDRPKLLAVARTLKRGDPIKLLFEVRTYRDALQLIVKGLRVVEAGEEGYDPAALMGEGADLVAGLGWDTLVFDIETVPAHELRNLPPTIANAVAKSAERSESDDSKVMSLSPWFGKVVSLAVGDGDVDPDNQPVHVFVVAPEGVDLGELPDEVRVVDEVGLLRAFWHLAARADTVVSYNGSGFDVPFLVTRSLIHGIPASVDLLSSPFSLRPHLDLYKVLGTRRGGPSSLDVVCWALGIQSPKGDMDGSMVAPAYASGNLAMIAEYNAGDVRATTRVFQRTRDDVLAFRDDWA